MALAVYIDYEKEMSKITKDPNLKKITRFAWDWGWARGTYSPNSYALKGCKKQALKYKLSGGECLIVDFRKKSGMDGTEYSEFLDTIKKRSGNEAFYDAGFVKGPGEMVTNYIKSGGFLGNILKTVLQGGKDAGVMAMNKAGDIKN